MLFSYFHWEHIWLKNFFWKGIQCWAEDIYVPIFNPQCFLKNTCSALLLQDFTNSSSWMISFRSWYTWIGCCCLYVFCTNTDWFHEKFHWGYYRKQIPRHSTPSSQKNISLAETEKKKIPENSREHYYKQLRWHPPSSCAGLPCVPLLVSFIRVENMSCQKATLLTLLISEVIHYCFDQLH